MTRRAEPCLCGGAIVAPTTADIPAAVRAHQSTARHRAWAMGLRVPQSRRDARPEPGDRVPCIGVGERGCLAEIPPDRVRCSYCVRTIALAGSPA